MTEGYVYIAYGNVHINEAIESATRLREVDTDAKISLITNTSKKFDVFDEIIYFPDMPGFSFSGKVEYLGYKAYDKNIYLDTDTWFVDSPRALFKTLDYCDVCICPDPAEVEVPHYPGMVPYNTGVVGYKDNFDLFEFFRVLYKTASPDFWEYHPFKTSLKTDQPHFAIALASKRVRVQVLNGVWNARYRFYTDLSGPVKIIHGPKPAIGWKELASRMNSRQDNRCWNPRELNLV